MGEPCVPPRHGFPHACAEGGNRTHTPQGEPDFESGASANSATSARDASYSLAARIECLDTAVIRAGGFGPKPMNFRRQTGTGHEEET